MGDHLTLAVLRERRQIVRQRVHVRARQLRQALRKLRRDPHAVLPRSLLRDLDHLALEPLVQLLLLLLVGIIHVVLRVGDGAPVPLKNEVVELVVVHRCAS